MKELRWGRGRLGRRWQGRKWGRLKWELRIGEMGEQEWESEGARRRRKRCGRRSQHWTRSLNCCRMPDNWAYNQKSSWQVAKVGVAQETS
jgi:hypothetical protein